MRPAPGTVWLDTARPDAENSRSLRFERPATVLVAATPADVGPTLASAAEAVTGGRYVAGFVAYEAGLALAGLAAPAPDLVPLVWLGVYDAPADGPPLAGGAVAVSDVVPAWTRADYRARHAVVRERIREGDVYQINLTFPLTARVTGGAAALYAALRARQPVPYGAAVFTGVADVVSLSPELFFRRAGDRIVVRPMKGTRPRGATAAEDDARRADLVASAKERAENLMIVDLLRNDLSVVCEPGTVTVPALFATEAHPTLHQMTSTVEGQLRPGVDLADLFGALFPSGSVTGAPKRRAMERIAALEDAPRGVYCGAIGFAGPGPDGVPEAVFNVAIRTVTLLGERATMGVGSGVVWDSEADAEYDECLLKGRFLTGLAS